jgi:hypothetical protein
MARRPEAGPAQAVAGGREPGGARPDAPRRHAPARPPRIFFTEAGLAALRAMMADRRLANPADYAHVRQELGIDLSRQGNVAAD